MKPEQHKALKEAMIALDMTLTGKDRATAEHTQRSKPSGFQEDPFFFVYGDSYSLSDGGYSRLLWSSRDYGVRVSDESLPAVKNRWTACHAEAAAVNALMQEFVPYGE